MSCLHLASLFEWCFLGVVSVGWDNHWVLELKRNKDFEIVRERFVFFIVKPLVLNIFLRRTRTSNSSSHVSSFFLFLFRRALSSLKENMSTYLSVRLRPHMFVIQILYRCVLNKNWAIHSHDRINASMRFQSPVLIPVWARSHERLIRSLNLKRLV